MRRNWQVVDEPDLTCGPTRTASEHPRVVMAGAGHRLATKTAVTVEDLAGETVNGVPPGYPSALEDALHPPRTPSGLPIHRSRSRLASPAQVFNMVARREIVSPAQARDAAMERAPRASSKSRLPISGRSRSA